MLIKPKIIPDLIQNKNLKKENHTPKQLIESNSTIVKNIIINGIRLIQLINKKQYLKNKYKLHTI